LKEAGLTEKEISRLRAPIGLDLGGRAPAEIALAVMAEIIATRAGSMLAIRR
jgi:xanthine dehydrogenase accessory factor